MKQVLLVAVLAALVSSAITLLVSGAFRLPALSDRSAGSPATAADFKAALADLEREVAALRREMAPGGSVSPAPPSPGAADSPSPRSPSPIAAPVVRDAKSPEVPVPPVDALGRFREVLPRTAEGDRNNDARIVQKRRWLLRGEREVLDHFGLPQTIQPEGELETWYYEIPTGAMTEDGYPECENFWIKINRGRLVEMGD